MATIQSALNSSVQTALTSLQIYVKESVELTISNPGAETGDTTSWINSVGSLGVRSASPAPNSGSYYFYGGDNLETKAYQDLDLISDGVAAADIDAGDLQAYVKWYQASYAVADEAQVYAEFLNSSKTLISTISIGLGIVRPSQTWQLRRLRGNIPVNTRYIRLYQHMYRNSGTNNDGYVDDISVEVIYDTKSLGITNNDGDTGDDTGWTNETGSLGVKSNPSGVPYTEGYSFYGGDNAETEAYQEISLSANSVNLNRVDKGLTFLRVEWYQSGYSGDNDSAEVNVRFDNASKVLISSYDSGLIEYDAGWNFRDFFISIPANTRFIDVQMHMVRAGGTENNGYVDEIFATVYANTDVIKSSLTSDVQSLLTDGQLTVYIDGTLLSAVQTALTNAELQLVDDDTWIDGAHDSWVNGTHDSWVPYKNLSSLTASALTLLTTAQVDLYNQGSMASAAQTLLSDGQADIYNQGTLAPSIQTLLSDLILNLHNEATLTSNAQTLLADGQVDLYNQSALTSDVQTLLSDGQVDLYNQGALASNIQTLLSTGQIYALISDALSANIQTSLTDASIYVLISDALSATVQTLFSDGQVDMYNQSALTSDAQTLLSDGQVDLYNQGALASSIQTLFSDGQVELYNQRTLSPIVRTLLPVVALELHNQGVLTSLVQTLLSDGQVDLHNEVTLNAAAQTLLSDGQLNVVNAGAVRARIQTAISEASLSILHSGIFDASIQTFVTEAGLRIIKEQATKNTEIRERIFTSKKNVVKTSTEIGERSFSTNKARRI